MKGIILTGGRGTRLWPTTKATCKQLLPIYDKPLIYYPLTVLIQAGITEILFITTPEDQDRFKSLLGTGAQWGLSFSFAVQDQPRGIADCFRISEGFIGKSSVALILGDNLFYGHSLREILKRARKSREGAVIFGYEVHDPMRYGVLSFDPNGKVNGIFEKPKNPPSRFAVTGLYFYDNSVVEIAKGLRPSARGELEITDVNACYLEQGRLECILLDRGFAWLDTGTPGSMHNAAMYVQTLQERQGIMVGCVEEVAYEMGRIEKGDLRTLGEELRPSDYGLYLEELSKR